MKIKSYVVREDDVQQENKIGFKQKILEKKWKLKSKTIYCIRKVNIMTTKPTPHHTWKRTLIERHYIKHNVSDCFFHIPKNTK